ncbi:LSU ribosomal protein L4P [Pseudonocardia thermophila]|uniref:Large ribosomal subunit protein uL4 n=1 Tax=Pseudonocardia thermophila TaxID=1848 RepID=A0A1M6X6Z8_PSETH|nr:LSU ribosomal protein L4P [Pseudonocardia thermophila]
MTTLQVELPEHVFNAQANIALMHQVVVAQLAAARQGTHDTKTRGEVSGGGRKPYRQKGTGRARQGSTRAPQFTGGGIVHGPTPRDYSQRTPKKMKAAALRGALSDRARAGRVHVVDALVSGDKPSTKAGRTALAEVVEPGTKVLVVVTREDALTQLSLRNLPEVHLIAPDQLNTYDVLVNDAVVFLKDAYDQFLAGPIATKAAARKNSEKPSLQKAAAPAGADEQHPYGPQSHAPLPDGSQPEGYPVKGNADSMLYHVPGSSFYARTVAEVWFTSAEAAEAAGFRLPPSQRKEEEK